MKFCTYCFFNDSMSRTCGDDLCHKCNHCKYVDRTYEGEWLAFCKLTDEYKNITLGECFGNCKDQIK